MAQVCINDPFAYTEWGRWNAVVTSHINVIRSKVVIVRYMSSNNSALTMQDKSESSVERQRAVSNKTYHGEWNSDINK